MKRIVILTISFALLMLLAACGGGTGGKMTNTEAPKAAKVEHLLTNHGDTLVDSYYWLKERENPDVVNHIKAENEYCKAVMAHTSKLQEELFNEMKARIKEEDESVPTRIKNNYYYSKTVAGKQYHEYYRKIGSLDAEPQLLLDCNQLAEGKDYFDLGAYRISPNQRFLAYSTDTNGSERYNLVVKDLETGELLSDELTDIASVTWAADSKTLFYTIRDDAWRSYKVFRHTIGEKQSDDKEVYHEPDERFGVYSYLSKDERYVVISIGSQITSEYRLIPANDPSAQPKVFAARKQGVEYDIAPHGDKFFIRTNLDGAVNFRLMETPAGNTDWKSWKEVIPHNPNVKIEWFDEFKDYLAIAIRENGLRKINILKLADKSSDYIAMPDASYYLGMRSNPNFDDTRMEYVYTSMTRPSTTYEYDMVTKQQTILKQTELGVPYNPDDYQSERIFATASDGAQIPISIVYKKGLVKNGHNPTLLYGYGSYGASMDASFSSSRLSLLNRGFVYAIAHIRGGSDMGEQWYLDGKLMKKKNTFTDFIACAEKLITDKYTDAEHLGAMGASAGGLLMGAITNMRPDLFKAVIADVPFVDVMNTMCDPTLPLTVGEYEEWGNPVEDREAYEYMKSYSPYDNVTPREYPSILATAGFNDPRVSYWEPAKWVQKIRENNLGNSTVILFTDMGAGHGGASGRYDYLKEVALDYAFLIDLLVK